MRCSRCEKNGNNTEYEPHQLAWLQHGTVPGTGGMKRWFALCPACNEIVRKKK